MNRQNLYLEYFTFAAFFLTVLYLIALMVWPFLSSVIFAGILAGAFYPLMKYFVEQMGLSRTLGAFLVSALIVMFIFVPSIYIIVRISQEILDFFRVLSSNLSEEDNLKKFFFGTGYSSQVTKQVFEYLNVDYNIESFRTLVLDGAKDVGLRVVETVNSWLSNLFSFLFQFLVMVLLIFALMLNGPRMKRFILDLSPLPNEDEELIIRQFNQINYVTLVCNGMGGLIQGVLAGFGFWVAGIGSVLLWTTVMVVLAFIPLVGISVIVIPACIYLALTGHWVAGVVLFIYSMVVSIATENWFKPKFMGKQANVDSFLVFFSIIGGMSVFGMAGIFYGPVIITIFLTFVHLYHKRYSPVAMDEP